MDQSESAEAKVKTTVTTEYETSSKTSVTTEHETGSQTKVTSTESRGETWISQVREKFEDVANAIIPDSLQQNKRVVYAFDHLSDMAKKASQDVYRHPELEWDATVRDSNELCADEEKFVRERKEFIRDKFAKYIGVNVEEVDTRDIPIIGFAGSGGGFRAMIATTGYLLALEESGLYDCGIYHAGVSGSCWNIAAQYTAAISEQESPLQALLAHFKSRLNTSIMNPSGLLKALTNTTSPDSAVELVFGGIAQKRLNEIDCGVIDVYGALLAARLLLGQDPSNQHKDFKLSEQKRFLEGGRNPMPIYTALHHSRPWKDFLSPEDAAQVPNYEEVLKKHHLKRDHYQWFEFTPFEIGCDEFPAWVPSWAFGRKFEFKKSIDRVPEQNFALEVGVFGAAPCAPIVIDIRQFEHFLPEGWLKNEWNKLYSGAMHDIGQQRQWKFEGHHVVPEADNNNFTYHLDPPPYKLGVTNSPILHFIDAGASNDLPLYPLTHPGRKVDIIIGFDSSSQIINHDYFEEEQDIFTERRGITSVKRERGIPESKYLEVYDYIPNGNLRDGYTPAAKHPVTFLYLPFLKNEKLDPNFEPSKAKFCAFNNFTYTEEEIDLVVKLARYNWLEVEKTVKSVIKEAWEKKRAERLKGHK